MALYESEHTLFMREMMLKNPTWAAEQREGRALLWDKPVSLSEQENLNATREQPRSYPYDVNFDQV